MSYPTVVIISPLKMYSALVKFWVMFPLYEIGQKGAVVKGFGGTEGYQVYDVCLYLYS